MPTIAIDAQDKVHILYLYDLPGGPSTDIWEASNASGSWQKAAVTTSGSGGNINRLSISGVEGRANWD